MTDLLPKVKTPTLVLHRTGDRACSVKGGRELAAYIPNARLIIFDGIEHLPWLGDSDSVLYAIKGFIGNEVVSAPEPSIEKIEEKKVFQRKLTTILSADVSGYSRLMGDNDEATISTLSAFKEVMVKSIINFRGRVIDSVGDNMLAEFASVIEAVKCAIEIQNAHKIMNCQLPENRRMEYRIGLNLGDVIEEGGRIYGDGVNIAARVQDLAENGSVCISGNVYDQVESKLGVSMIFLGEKSLKNITKPVRVYKI